MVSHGWSSTRGWTNTDTTVEVETNNFTLNQQTGTDTLSDTTDFTKLTANDVLSSSTTTAKEGTRSLKCVTGNTGSSEGFYTNSVVATASVENKLSVWLAGSGTVKAYISERTSADAYVGETASDTITLSGTFQEVILTRTFGVTGVKTRLKISTPTQQVATIYADKLRVCKTSEW